MKLIYFSQFFSPEHNAAAFRCYENAKEWILSGADVTVFTGYPNYPTGKIFEGYKQQLFAEERIDDIRVLRSKLIVKPNSNFIKRLFCAGSFFAYGCLNFFANAKKIGSSYDIVLATSGTIFAALLGYVFARKNRIPFVFELRDITYIQLVATGKHCNSKSVLLMKYLELFLCKRAAMVICVTNGFKTVLEKECNDITNKIHVVPNGVDVQKQHQISTNTSNLTLAYFGTLGISQNILDTMFYAEAIQAYTPFFKYLIIGDGAQAEAVREVCKNTPFTEYKPGMSPEVLESFYSDTSLGIVVLRKTNAFRYTIPSKLFQLMGRGIPVLYIGPDGEAAEIVRKYQSGIALTESREGDLENLRNFFSNPDWAAQLYKMGENGRRAVSRNYSRKKLAKEYLGYLQSCVKV